MKRAEFKGCDHCFLYGRGFNCIDCAGNNDMMYDGWYLNPITGEIKDMKVIQDYSNPQGGYIEKDPNGLNAKEPGSKLDSGKICVTRGCFHYFPRALRAIAELSTIGARKYSWKGWASVPDGIHRYGDALGRHELEIEDDYTRKDPDTGVLEATAVAWNACARLELILKEQEKK